MIEPGSVVALVTVVINLCKALLRSGKSNDRMAAIQSLRDQIQMIYNGIIPFVSPDSANLKTFIETSQETRDFLEDYKKKQIKFLNANDVNLYLNFILNFIFI